MRKTGYNIANISRTGRETGMEDLITTIDGREIKITNPQKLLWPDAGITKLDYIKYLLHVSPYLLAYTRDRLLMRWRYPDGIGGEKVEEKAIPNAAPSWVPRAFYKDKDWILLNDSATLAWVANREAQELHVPFDRYNHKNYPTELVFDLDPPSADDFSLVLEVALKLKEVLDSLGLFSVAKTSGASGMQIYVPIEPKITFEETRMINKFIADYMVERIPDRITLERVVKKRGKKLYFDYLQLWKGRTMPAPYSVRAKPGGTVSAPVTWEEVQAGVHPADFTMRSMPERIAHKGDLFRPLTTEKERYNQKLEHILSFLKVHA